VSDSYFGRGTTPEKVAEAIERARDERDRGRPAPSTAKREEFFRRMAEEIKRAKGGD
jgi:hypothetical protein